MKRKRPAPWSPKPIRTAPATIRNTRLLTRSWKTKPIRLTEAPSVTKIDVKPEMNASAWTRDRTRDVSPTDVPASMPMYAGTRGSTQGDAKDRTPAPNATRSDRFPVMARVYDGHPFPMGVAF